MTSKAARYWLVGAALVALATPFAGCAEDSRSLDGECEDVPLYRLVYDEDEKTWTRVAVDGGPLSAEDNARIDAELNREGPRCLTPTGSAVSSSSGGAPGSDAGTGGATGTGGASDAGTGGASDAGAGGATGTGGASDAGRD